MRFVKGVYVDDVTVRKPDGTEVRLHVWMNPKSGRLFAIDNMEIPACDMSVPDPYVANVRVVFEDTFTGLPK